MGLFYHRFRSRGNIKCKTVRRILLHSDCLCTRIVINFQYLHIKTTLVKSGVINHLLYNAALFIFGRCLTDVYVIIFIVRLLSHKY